MFCARCGQENSDQAQFCQGCGAALQEHGKESNAAQAMIPDRLLGLVGLIAGILALVGIFNPWATASMWGMSLSVSAWDSVTNAKFMGEEVGREGWAVISLIGAILTLLGGLCALAYSRTRVLWGILGIGGILAVIGAAWGYSGVMEGSEGAIAVGVSAGRGTGLYLTLVGGILGLCAAGLGFWVAASSKNPLTGILTGLKQNQDVGTAQSSSPPFCPPSVQSTLLQRIVWSQPAGGVNLDRRPRHW